MSSIFRSLIRISSFFRKEVVEVIRQPRLVLTLILGPFLILLLFGVGYRNEPRVVEAVFVVEPNSNLIDSIEEYASSLGEQLVYSGTLPDAQTAIDRLWRGEVDLVVIAPTRPEDSIRNDQPAIFQLYHNEIDPAQEAYLRSLGQIYIDEVNRRVISQLALQAQTNSATVREDIASARENAAQMRQALEVGNVALARERQRDLAQNLSSANDNVGPKAILLDAIERETGTNNPAESVAGLLGALIALQESPAVIDNPVENQPSYDAEIAELRETEEELADIEEMLAQFDAISPDTMVRPFRSELTSIAPTSTADPMNFYAPAVIALLLQHMAVTFGALSLVRERLSGTMELFRVSPIASGEALIGKYLSYLLFGLVMGAVLFLLMYYLLRVPLLGTWWSFGLVVLALLFTSLGLGFIISLLAETESQAVQLSMISLLVAVFFSGLFLDLRYLIQPVQVVSWLTPATYGTHMLQNVILRGYGVEVLYMTGLLILGGAFFMVGWILLQRQMRLG